MPSSSPARLSDGRVLWGSLITLLLPGASHLLAGKRLRGALLLVAFFGGLALALTHLWTGLALFESRVGNFLFPILLRALVLLHGFAVLDGYCWGVDPGGTRSLPTRRLAVGLNLLLPGAGYLAARAWLRAATGFALLTLIVIFAAGGRHRYLDLIYIGMQLIMALAVYHQVGSKAQAELDKAGKNAPELPKAPGAQVVVLVALVAGLGGLGWVVQQALPGAASVSAKDIDVRPAAHGIHLAVPKLGLALTLDGDGWIATPNPGGGLLFSADHKGGAQLRVGVQPIPNFVRPARSLERIQTWLQGMGLRHEKSLPITVGSRQAVQMRFSQQQDNKRIDRWCVAIPVPEQKLAYLLLIDCQRQICKQLQPMLERTRDSLRVGN